MDYQNIALERVRAVGVIRLNQPEKLNAVSAQTMIELDHAVDTVVADCRALLITGAGKSFCAGADLTGSLDDPSNEGEPDAGAYLETLGNPFMTKLRNLPIPIVSAVRGAVAGVGCSLALIADIVVASDTAYFLQAFAKIGLVPDGGASYMLVRAVGRARALEMALLAERLPAKKALEWGLIARVVPDAELDGYALSLADGLAKGPTRSLAMIRELIATALDSDWATTLHKERILQRDACRTGDHQEGVAAFLAKRPAVFTGA